MKAAPTATIDAAGLATWTDDPTCTGGYDFQAAFDNGYPNWGNGSGGSLPPNTSSFDTSAAGWVGGQRLVLIGIDADGNICTNPTSSIGNLTKNV